MSELTVQEAALAWAQGKTVEVKYFSDSLWKPLDRPGELNSKCASPGVFSLYNFQFRLAQEPPKKKWRPWTAEEVPVGALITRPSLRGEVLMIIGKFPSGALLAGYKSIYNLDRLFEAREHSIDGGKTWLPCGVEVTE